MRQIIRTNPRNRGQQRARMRPQPPKGMALFHSAIGLNGSQFFMWTGNGQAWGMAPPEFSIDGPGFLPWRVTLATPELVDGAWFWVYEVDVDFQPPEPA